MEKWVKTNFPGVRYRRHSIRKHGVKKDMYFSIRYKLNGRDKEEGLGWASQDWTAAKAYDALKELRENVKRGEGPQSLREKREIELKRQEQQRIEATRLKKEAITFKVFFEESYLPQARADKKASSVIREKILFDKWLKGAIGHILLRDVLPFHMEKLKLDMAKKRQSPRSIEYALAVVRQVFRAASRMGCHGGAIPTSGVKIPKVDNARMRFLTRTEAAELLRALRAKSLDAHDMTLISLHCGLRFGEIAALTWQDVDLDKGVMTIRDAKTGSRYAFLTRQAIEMLKGRPAGKPAEYVFPGRGGKMTRVSPTFFRVVDELKLNEGVDDRRLKICFHSCRHSYASWLVEEGQDLYTVQKLLGHKTNVMTQRYAHLAENRLREAVRALGRSLQKMEPDKIINVTTAK